MMKENWVYCRGDIYCANLDPVVGSEQGGIRPVIVIQNDTGNKLLSGKLNDAPSGRLF